MRLEPVGAAVENNVAVGEHVLGQLVRSDDARDQLAGVGSRRDVLLPQDRCGQLKTEGLGHLGDGPRHVGGDEHGPALLDEAVHGADFLLRQRPHRPCQNH